MRLKTLIIVGAGISLLITALLAAGLVWFTQNQSRLLRERYAADEFINGVYQLELLTSDYLLNHRQRAAEQWRLHFRSLQDASKRLSSVFPPRERDLINGNLDKLQQLFALTVESFGGGGVPGAVSSRQRILAGQLKTSIERVVSDVRHLSSDYATQFITFNAELRRFVWISFIVAAVLLGGLWLLVALRVIQPIHRLGMQIQHFAQDPDFRLENSRPDEVGDLSRSFDRLADRLQATTVSVESLQAEVEERRQIVSALRRSERRLALLLDTLPYGVQENDIHGVITFSNAAHHRMLGRKQGDLIGQSIWDYMATPEESERLRKYLPYLVEVQPQPAPYLAHCARLDGRAVDLEVIWDYQRDQHGRLTGFISVISDVTARRATEERLRLLADVFENTAEGVVIIDADANVIETNTAFTEIMGYTREEVLGRNPRLWSSGHHDQQFYRGMWLALEQTGQWRGEIWNRRKNGEVFPEWQHISAVKNEEGILTHYISVFSDISQIKEAREKLDHLAHHDPLTGLPNRLLLLERLEQAIKNARRHNRMLAVVFIDLDRFKHVNDSLGHAVGDQLLRSVAGRLQESVREIDTVSRIGGDEFVLLLEDIEKTGDVLMLVEKLMHRLEDVHQLDDHDITVTPSIGVCLYPEDGTDTSTMLRHADAAMYRAKEEGRDTFSYYTEELTRDAVERVKLESQLANALRHGEFELYFQPQIDLPSGRMIGMEALVRWHSPELGLVSPARFIPVAENSGVIHAIGRWVLHDACRQGRKWLDEGRNFGYISVNVAGPQIQRGDLPAVVREVLDETGLPAERLELEITEGFIMRHTESTVSQLQALRDLGVSLAIDDFGTGHSSLAYLKQLPAHKLKIDRSFVRDIASDPNDKAIVDAVIAMGRSLGLTVVAEGVETQQQADFLRQAGCHQAQGYLYARPLPAGEIGDLAEQNLYWI